tara:strand:+ start:214 stop:435 length:222 start_codon:yes stop_codon:yes gene_type:complete
MEKNNLNKILKCQKCRKCSKRSYGNITWYMRPENYFSIPKFSNISTSESYIAYDIINDYKKYDLSNYNNKLIR